MYLQVIQINIVIIIIRQDKIDLLPQWLPVLKYFKRHFHFFIQKFLKQGQYLNISQLTKSTVLAGLILSECLTYDIVYTWFLLDGSFTDI